MKQTYQKYLRYLVALLLGGSFVSAAASGPFEVVTDPGTTLPSTVIADGKSYAYYRVTNKTNSVLSESFVKHLPPNVTQEIFDPNYCGATFNLAKTGNPGDYCVLKLTVTGTVDSADPDPTHQLYVCADEYNCTRAQELLDVEVVTALAAGAYCVDVCETDANNDTASEAQVMLVQRQDDNWSYIKPEGNLPDDFTDFPVLLSVSCAENFCMAGGAYMGDFIEKPLLTMSTNGASSWGFERTYSDEFLEGQIFAVSCGDDLCVAGGTACSVAQECGRQDNKQAADFSINPLVTYSTDGVSWGIFEVLDVINDVFLSAEFTYQGDVYTVTNEIFYVSNGTIHATGCSDTSCVVGGNYDADITICEGLSGEPGFCSDSFNDTIPLLLTSDTDGDRWEAVYPLTPTYAVQNGFLYYSGEFLATSCSESFCIAGGIADSNNDFHNSQNILLAVQDGNDDWKYAQDFMDEVNNNNGGILNSVNCTGTLCLVGGRDSHSSPLLVLSTDGFEHAYNWTYVSLYPESVKNNNEVIPDNAPPAGYTGTAEILGVSCDANVCVAVGDYQNQETGNFSPLLVQTTNSGNNWSYVTNLPADMTSSGSGEFFNVSCSKGICAATGIYFPSKGSLEKPLLAESINGGPWTYITSLPSDFVMGGLLGINAPGSGNASAAYKFLLK